MPNVHEKPICSCSAQTTVNPTSTFESWNSNGGENQERSLARLQQTHTDVHPYSLENLRKGSEILINARLQVDGLEAECGILIRVEGQSTFGKVQLRTHDLRGDAQHQ
jgi:hypothetical protein